MTEDKTIEKLNFTTNQLDDEYYNCIFEGCDFSNLFLDKTMFDTCEFKECDFSLTKFKQTISTTKFVECKMSGADFSNLNRFSSDISFYKSQLNYVNLSEIKLQNILFKECNLYEAIFDNADIAKSIFERSDLSRASFIGTNLEKADFSTAFNFSINPTSCKLKKAIFSESGLRGLVDYLDIEIR